MPALGITGSIATGKTTFREALANACRVRPPVFDADLQARNVLNFNQAVRNRVLAHFGPDAYLPEGPANRQYLRERIFKKPADRDLLEGLIHPEVLRDMRAFAEAHAGAMAIVDIPLLFETGSEAVLKPVVVVACSRETQSARLAARGITPKDAEHILASQLPQEEKILKADIVIWNDGSLDNLRDQALALLKTLN